MAIEAFASAGAKWLWEKYGREIVDRAADEWKEKWRKFHWDEAEQKYYKRIIEQYSTTRLLGYPKPVSIEGIFTDVYVLESLTSLRRFDIEELQALPMERDTVQISGGRKPIYDLLQKTKLLFILGKPGAGKTTLLKYITMTACSTKINTIDKVEIYQSLSQRLAKSSDPTKSFFDGSEDMKTPFFTSLKEWSDTNLTLMEFLLRQLEICDFPNGKAFLEQILKSGDALLLFDGLDEVGRINRQEDFTRELKELYKSYPECRIIITCRIAAIDYFFDQFTYVEIADFDDKQIRTFIAKWFKEDQGKMNQFLAEMYKPENRGLLELGRTPLLLALMCLAYDETMVFPRRRVELYKEALDSLLKKWDASRGIKRDELYHNLPPRRKEQLLAQIATDNFVKQKYFVTREELVVQITNYLKRLPPEDLRQLPPDGEVVLNAIESQHGLLVERAHGIYSFSHLTFQEYLVARYIVDNTGSDSLENAFYYLQIPQWNEVFTLVASLLDDADPFFHYFNKSLIKMIMSNNDINTMLHWVNQNALKSKEQQYIARTVMTLISLAISRRGLLTDGNTGVTDIIRSHVFAIKISYDIIRRVTPIDRAFLIILKDAFSDAISNDVDKVCNFQNIGKLVQQLGITLTKDDLNIRFRQIGEIIRFLQVIWLYLDCLQLAIVTNREDIKKQLLLLSDEDRITNKQTAIH
jgi:adenylate kinase